MLTFESARSDVLSYLQNLPDDYFWEHHTTKTKVLLDKDRIDLMASEHMKCVNSFGCERGWSCKDACEVEPGIAEVQNDKTTVFENTVNDAVSEIKRKYLKSDVCMGEFLKTVEIIGLSVEQVVKVYATLYREFEGDEVCRIDEDGMRYSIGT